MTWSESPQHPHACPSHTFDMALMHRKPLTIYLNDRSRRPGRLRITRLPLHPFGLASTQRKPLMINLRSDRSRPSRHVRSGVVHRSLLRTQIASAYAALRRDKPTGPRPAYDKS